jgi:ABC-2 type transport system ATP-binding protein
MDDLVDLAKRVIVIDQGKILFDGGLRELMGNFAKEKIIRIFLSKEVDYTIFEKVGDVIKIEHPQVVLSVPRSTAAVAAAEILQHMPVADLTIEEEPIEEIVRRVFKGEVINPR